MKLSVVHRRWRYKPKPGLTVTGEYKRVMKKFKSFKSFRHTIKSKSKELRDGDPYDIVDIEIA